MKFQEALSNLEQIKQDLRNPYITRENWPYRLYFCKQTGYLMLGIAVRSELSPYVISLYDFNYEWELIE